MPDQVLFGIEAATNGLMAGVMYSLVALGFVLIFKASGIFNYAQGVMALFAALTLVGLQEGQVPFAHLINAIFGTDVHHFGWHLPAFLAILLALQERALRRHRIDSGLIRALPPLTMTESLLFRLIGVGFVFLTLTLVSGVLFVDDLFAQHLAHKTILSIASWLVFGVLLFGRWRWGWRGGRAVRLTLIGMSVLLLAFFGSKFVLEMVLHRPL